MTNTTHDHQQTQKHQTQEQQQQQQQQPRQQQQQKQQQRQHKCEHTIAPLPPIQWRNCLRWFCDFLPFRKARVHLRSLNLKF